MSTPILLSPAQAVGLVILGIVLSVVLPIAVRAIKRASALEARGKNPTFGTKVAAAWKSYGGNKYLGLLLGATVVALFIVFLTEMKFHAPREAVLAGFAWESFLNKFVAKSPEAQS